MGILRSDRVSGLGGANAINGSVFFSAAGGSDAGGPYLTTPHSDDFAFGSGEFTIEFWIRKQNGGKRAPILAQQAPDGSSDDYACWIEMNADNTIEFQDQTTGAFASTGTISEDTWTHVALVRDGNTLRWFIGGVASGTDSESGTMRDSAYPLSIGKWGEYHNSHATNIFYFEGFLSNLRIQKGKAEYTAAFTPPTTRLSITPETVLLCCQSPGNAEQEATGKILQAVAPTNGSPPKASRISPDKGEDHGTTFADGAVFDTLSYMVPPGGTTTQSNRGRGVLGGGAPFVSPNVINAMQYIEVQSGGIFKDFGDLTVARGYFPAGQTASSTRGISAGGWTGSDNNTIDYITIATTSNATEFGDTSVGRPSGGLSNQTRCVTAGDAGALGNTIDYVTIATTGNASDFGDLTEGRGYLAGVASPTRGVFGGGRNNTPSSNTQKNTMEYITIATTGNAADFGDISSTRYGQTGFSSAVRGIWAGGYAAPGQTKLIDYFTIATLGNSADFGDLSTNNGYCASVTNSIRGAVTINDAPNYYNALEYITIATTGDAKDFGDSDPTGSGKGHGDFPSCMSDSHGGIS